MHFIFCCGNTFASIAKEKEEQNGKSAVHVL